MNNSELLSELESKNDDICQFLRRYLINSNIKLDETFFDLLSKKLQNHDKLLVQALDNTNARIEKLVSNISKHINIA